jgi:hypothetical protein
VLTQLKLRPGQNTENTRYASEGGWWACDKVRFRAGAPESIGGWVRLSAETFKGTPRSLGVWLALNGARYVGIGTTSKFYIENGGTYYDITPVRATATLTDPFATVLGSATVTVTAAAHGMKTGDFVVFSGAAVVGGLDLNGDYEATVTGPNTFTITAVQAADANATGGGATVLATFLLPSGTDGQVPVEGWGIGGWGLGDWGFGQAGLLQLRLWSQSPFGQDLVFCPRGGALYTWSASGGSPLLTRAVDVSSLPGADQVPTIVNMTLVSDISRFVFAFGCNEIGELTLDPMLIRWADQETLTDWMPTPLNQAGGLRLSIGSRIVARIQLRQEVLVWTDAALYSLQYNGPPLGWGAQLLGDNISIVSPNCVATAAGAAFWMGARKFYTYNGQVQPLRCDVLRTVFDDFTETQALQVFAGTVEEFNEVWWFYPSRDSDVPNKYVVYNYGQDIWYTGELTRFAWNDSALLEAPLGAGQDRLVYHELGADDLYTETPAPIRAYIESSAVDIDNGERFAFVRKVFPDVTFTGSEAANPAATMTLYPMKAPGTPFGGSVGGDDSAGVVRGVSAPVETFTEQLYLRVRGRQLVVRFESNMLGVRWQLGVPRLEVRPDGMRA